MGYIFKHGRKWWIKYYDAGKMIRENSRSTKKMVAKKLLEQREGEIAQGKIPRLYLDKITFEELAKDFITDYRINGKKSLARAERSVRLHLKPIFGNMRANQISTANIKDYISQRMEQGAMHATINRELAALKRMFNLGARQTPSKVDRVPYIPMLNENNTRKGFFTHEEFRDLIEALPAYLKGFTIFAYRTGWRFSEIAGLTWSRVNREEGIVRIESGETKNKEGRTVYLDDELQEIIRRQFSCRNLSCPFVFHRSGQQIKDIRYAWKSACRTGKLKGRLFHDLRRTAIRNMIRAGIPERVAMKISGHKTRSVFDRYNIVSSEDLKQAALSQAEYLKKAVNLEKNELQ